MNGEENISNGSDEEDTKNPKMSQPQINRDRSKTKSMGSTKVNRFDHLY